MCKEGIRIGRKTQVKITSVAVQTTSTQLLKNDANRIAIIFPIPQTNPIWMMPGAVAVANRGFQTYATGHLETIDVQKHGQLAMMDWYGISPAGAQTIDIAEVLWVEE